jgi:hypothetical protein
MRIARSDLSFHSKSEPSITLSLRREGDGEGLHKAISSFLYRLLVHISYGLGSNNTFLL